jgi:hypothetical protein
MTLRNTAHPLSRDELVGSIAPYKGYATSDGAAAGASIIDAELISSNDFITGKTVLIMSGPCFRETKTAGTFDPITGTIPFAPGFSAQITAGTLYRVLTAGSGGGGGGFGSVSQDAIYFDPANGNTLVAGNDGSALKPLSTEADVLTQVAAKKFSRVKIADSEGTGFPTFTMPSDIVGISFNGDSPENDTVNLNGKNVDSCDFHFLYVTGTNSGSGYSTLHNCVIDLTATIGWAIFDSKIDALTVSGASNPKLYNCSFSLAIITLGYGARITLNGTGDVLLYGDGRTIVISGAISYGSIVNGTLVGTHTAANSATVMTDAAHTFIPNSLVGLTILNTTDGSSGVITANAAHTITVAALSGGADNTWETNDAYSVTVPPIVNDYTNRPEAETAVNITAILASETNFLDLQTAGFHYTVDDLVLKSADPGVNSVYVRLYKLVNGVLTAVNVDATHPNGFVITTANFDRYWTLPDMFGKQALAGDQIKITVQTSAGGPYAVTGSYASRSA